MNPGKLYQNLSDSVQYRESRFAKRSTAERHAWTDPKHSQILFGPRGSNRDDMLVLLGSEIIHRHR